MAVSVDKPTPPCTPPCTPPPAPNIREPLSTPRKDRPALFHLQSESEKFPSFLPAPKAPPKSKSLTEAEIKSDLLNDTQVLIINHHLQNDPPPLSLSQVRERRQSIRDERKKSIDFIRRRTISRAGAHDRPNLEALNEPKFDVVVEGKSGEKKD